MTLVILAGGMGSRFGGLKQIEPVDDSGNFIIDYTIYDAIKVGFTKVVFIIKEENYEIFKSTIGQRVESKIKVKYVFQSLKNIPKGYKIPKDRIKPLGTAHAILECRNVVKEKFVIVNADDFYGRDALQAIYDFMNQDIDDSVVGLVGYKLNNTLTDNGSVKRGIINASGDLIKGLDESKIDKINDKQSKACCLASGKLKTISNDTLVSMNLMGFNPSFFEKLDIGLKEFLENNKSNMNDCEYLITNVLNDLLANKEIVCKLITTNAKWIGMTYKEDLESVKNSFKELVEYGEYPQKLWE